MQASKIYGSGGGLHFVHILNLHYMEVNGQLHASAALPPGIENLLATEQEAGCGPRAGLDVVQKTDSLLSLPGNEPTFDGCPAPFGHLLMCQPQVSHGLLIYCRLQSHVQNQSELLLLVLLSRPLLLPFFIAKCSSRVPVTAVCCVRTCIIGSITTA